MNKKTPIKTKAPKDSPYRKFKSLDGSHPLKELLPDSYIPYKARLRKGGKVVYFNFDLAKEMGLIPKEHDIDLNEALEKQILDSFALLIINEYDELHETEFKPEEIKPGTYMATRYLQPQHDDQIGLKSGDGRSIWNGAIKHKGRTWDVSSRGTGATKLSPATSKYGKFFQSGDPTISYGCGYAELDEAIESVFFSEVLHRNNVSTERTLAVIEFEKGIVIGVRAYENLLRPSHLFRHLKQNNLVSLETMTHYFIDRQESNGRWNSVPTKKDERLEYFLKKQLDYFAKTVAKFEDDYIFCWIDWDGDNVLMDGGIIDYGSVRQFGMYHHSYQFDDDGKYSITITEQKRKARYIVQTFIQLVDALIQGKKTNLKEFASHKLLKEFDIKFEEYKNQNILRKIGFEERLIEALSKEASLQVFRKAFSFWERVQAEAGAYELSDGINHDAVFCMRDILRENPQLLMENFEALKPEEFLEIIRSSYAEDEDLFLNQGRKEHIANFQKSYMALVKKAAELEKCSLSKILLNLTVRSSVINKYDRITGDAITMIVSKLLGSKPKFTNCEIYHILERFISYQDLSPDKVELERKLSPREEKLMQTFFIIIRDYREGL